MSRTIKGQIRREGRYHRVVELSLTGHRTGQIAKMLECSGDLVRHYKRMARANGIALPISINQNALGRKVSDWGNEKWRALER